MKEQLYFSQQHIYTQLGHTVRMEDTPHYDFLVKDGKSTMYEDYLRTSWKYYFPKKTNVDIENMILKQIEKFKKLATDIKKNGIIEPIQVFRRLNKDLMVYDGNHRSVIGLYYGIKIPTKMMDLKEVLTLRTRIPSIFYGSLNKGVPYQSIYSPDGIELLHGRRNDLLLRSLYIDKKDIKGKVVLDLGCNYGNSLFLLSGAKRMIGIDVSSRILTSAVRLAVIFKKKVEFMVHDLNRLDILLPEVDTAFMFSLDAHLKGIGGITRIIELYLKKVLYFETHEHGEIPIEIERLFKKCEFLLEYSDRKLYRLEK